MNPFESGARKVIPAVLIYAFRETSSGAREFLMIHRNSKAGDYHAGKWNGLGGKLELDESPLEAARRELREESGLDLEVGAFQALGLLTFPNFKAHKQEDWYCSVFVARVPDTKRDQKVAGPEGDLHWVEASKLASLNLWEGDRHFIEHVAAARPFVGTIWYEGQNVARHWIQKLV